jgi:macrolide transport system ATP-binding/permease protein
MRLWHALQSRLRSLVFRGRREAELSEELQLHLDREIERLEAGGLSREEARFEARRVFGGVEQIKETCRDARGTALFDAVVRDTRYAARRLARDWRFTMAAVLILGLGIGANTAIFSLVNAALLRGQALPDPDRLVDIYQNDRGGRPIASSFAAYLEMAEYRDIFASISASFVPSNVSYLHDGAVRSGIAEHVTPTYFDVRGLRPSVGRWFEQTEDTPGAALVVVLGHQIWTTRFRADPSVVGSTIRIQGVPATIVGVGPANYRGTLNVGLVTDFWLPISSIAAVNQLPAPTDASRDSNSFRGFFVKARLREGRTVAQAKAAMDILARRRAAEHPDDKGGAGISVFSSSDVRIHPQADALMSALASVVLVIVGLVLAIACSNLATLLLVRGAARAKEVSVRLAIGASRRQIIRHLLAESVLLSLAGGAAGWLLAWWGVRALRGIELPVTVDVTLDVRVLAFAFALSLLTGVAFGLAPALKATRIDLLPTLRDEGTPPVDHRRLTLKNALIVFQVALSVLLLGGASVFLQLLSATRALHVDYAVNGVAMIETDARYAGYSGSGARTVYEELRRRIAAVPGVQSAALLRGMPMDGNSIPIVVDGAAGQTGSVEATMFEAGPGFFETLRLPLLYGRGFDERDRADTPRVAVISEKMARQHFGTVNAVGRRFRREDDPNSWTEVIGVARNTGTGDFSDDILDPLAPPFYRSHTQSDALPTTVIARTSGDAATLVATMQRELRALDIALPVITTKTMAQDLAEKQRAPKLVATFLGVLGALGLMLASIGLYAVVAFAVARRSREIGIRMALGARNQQVVWSVARGVAGLVGVGTGAGLTLAVVAMLALRAVSGSTDLGIGDVSVYSPDIDPLALLAIVAIMALVGVAAACVPARRAARMNPLVALRHE